MLAIDTNILVRYVTEDDVAQSRKARTIVEENDVYVSTTVMLESEWVLRGVYGFHVRQVVGALRAFAGLPRVTVEGPGRLKVALDRAEQGIDFADALHLGAAEGCEAMVTFDRDFIKAARAVSDVKLRLP